MGRRPTSLRRMYRGTLAFLAALLASTAIALIVLTTQLNQATSAMKHSLEGIRHAESIRVDLIRYARLARVPSTNPRANAYRREIRESIDRNIANLAPLIDTDEEREVFERIEKEIGNFLAVADELTRVDGPSTAALEAPFVTVSQAVEELATLDLAQARGAEQLADSADRLGDIIGYSMLAVLVVSVIGISLGVRRVYQPVKGLDDAVARFGSGERSVRAPETGPTEIRSISRSFNSAADMLQRQLRSVAAIAHDLRNPLTSMKITSSMLERLPADADQVRKRATLLRHQTARMDRMIEDLLDSARIEAGELVVRYQLATVEELVGDALALFPPEQLDRVQVKVPPEEISLKCDPLRVEQILANLISNALKYSPGSSPVFLEVQPNGEGVTFSVRDEGPGIAHDDQERVFEPFHRTRIAHESNIPGAGLGLSITRRLTEAHGGHILLESAPGHGSTFRVWLPWNPPEHAVVPETPLLH